MALLRGLFATFAFALIASISGRAMAAPPPLEVYGRLPKVEMLVLSPNGELVARISTEGEKRFLIVQRVGGDVVTAIPVSDLKAGDLEWASDDYLVVYLHQTARLEFNWDNQEFLQGVVIDVKNKKARPLVPGTSAYLSAVFGRYGFAQVDGATYGYFGVIPMAQSADKSSSNFTQGYPDLYQINLETGAMRKIANGSSLSPRWVLDDKGQIIAHSDYDNKTGDWHVYRAGSSTPIATGKTEYGFGVSGHGRSASTVLISASGHEGYSLKELNLNDGTQTDISDQNVDDVIRAPVSGLVVGTVLSGENHKTVMLEPTLVRHGDAIARGFAGDEVSVQSMSTDFSRIVVFVEGKSTPGTWQFVDFKTGKATPLAEMWPDIPNDMLAEVRVIDYPAGDGMHIKAILTLPPGRGANNLPLVVLPHGGPEAMDAVGFDWWAQAFASRGYAVLQPNFRGSSGHGAEFRNAGFGQWGRKMQTDVSDGVAALAAQGVIDRQRVCVVGGSYGGYVALAGVTLQHGIYKCAASYAGVSDPGGMLNYTVREQGFNYGASSMRYWRSYYGIAENSYSVPDEISPLARAAEADAPILLIHGEDDTVVPIDQSEHMESALRRANKSVELIKMKGEDHWLSRSATRDQMLEAMVGFVEKYNPAYDGTASH